MDLKAPTNRLNRILQDVCEKADLDPSQFNIIATTLDKADGQLVGSTIYIDKDYLENATDPELRYVVAHEIDHWRNDDEVKMHYRAQMARVITTCIPTFGYFAVNASSDVLPQFSTFLAVMAASLTAGHLASTGVIRNTEYARNRGAVDITGDLEGAVSSYMWRSGTNKWMPDSLREIFRTHPTSKNAIKDLCYHFGRQNPSDVIERIFDHMPEKDYSRKGIEFWTDAVIDAEVFEA